MSRVASLSKLRQERMKEINLRVSYHHEVLFKKKKATNKGNFMIHEYQVHDFFCVCVCVFVTSSSS